MSRPYKIVNGVSYPNLYNGPKKKVTANLSDPDEFYHDDGIRLAEENLADFVGKPICVEHDVTASVGEITAAWRDTDGKMRITGRIYVDSEDGKQLYDRVNSGDMKGLSVGYGVSMGSDGSVSKKSCQEISLCKVPFFEGAQVAICATGNEKYKTNEKGKIVFQIMASETNSAAVPLDSVNKDASELARAHDELLKKTEKEAAELKQLREENARFQREREEQLARYAESRKPQLKEVLDLTEQQYKEEKGPDAKISDNYRESIERVFLNPVAENEAAVITASAMTWKKARDQRIAMEARMKELEAKNSQMTSEQTHVKASLERINSINAVDSTKSVDVAASGDRPLTTANIFRVSERERNLYRENYGRELPVSVTASAQAPAPNIPTHNHVGLMQNSLRHSAPHMFAFACDSGKFANAPTRGITKTLTRLDD